MGWAYFRLALRNEYNVAYKRVRLPTPSIFLIFPPSISLFLTVTGSQPAMAAKPLVPHAALRPAVMSLNT